MLTKFGKRFLTAHVAGIVDFNSKDIAIGIANGTDYPSADTNSRLGFEFFRLPVTLGSIDVQPDELGGYKYYAVYKATLPQDVSGVIKEIGLYPGKRTSMNNYDSKYLSNFENVLDWIDSTGANPAQTNNTIVTPRIGDYTAEIRFGLIDTTNIAKEYKFAAGLVDISGYSVNDTITVAFNRFDTNSNKIRIKFYSSDIDYFYGDIDLTSLSTGDYIKEVSMNTIFSSISGTPDASNITYIGIEVYRTSTSSNAYIYMDGLRINDEDTFDPTYGLISRSVLSTPVTKVAGRPVDIEYRLELSF